MKKHWKYSWVFFIVFSYCFKSQQVTTRDTIKGTLLIISSDSKINHLLRSIEDKCKNTVAVKPNTRLSVSDATPSEAKTFIKTSSKELSKAEICKQNPRILGYKIQVNVVKSNAEANEVKAYFRKKFPNIKVETDASLRPNYKILAGSYLTKASASGDLVKIREYFKTATAVKYRVFCIEAK